MDLVDRAFMQWERLNQPRRARARLVVFGPTICALHREDLRPRDAAEPTTTHASPQKRSNPLP